MLVRAHLVNDCTLLYLDAGVSAWKIKQSVGLGGVNQRDDVLTIQRLLNLIGPEQGGPVPPLAEDGWIGPLTIGAIRKFQQFHQTASDSRVDPGGPTLAKMNAVPKRALVERNTLRLGRVLLSMPDLIAMAKKAKDMCDAAINFVLLGPSGLATSRRSYDLANLHFAFGEQPEERTLAELAFIRTTFRRVRTVLTSRPSPVTGGNPFGASIFDIDPLGQPHIAYSPRQSSDDRREDGVHSGRVYLCHGIDKTVADLFTHILLHELVHFVDDESQERAIGDHGYRELAMRLPHALRMRNSDNFALFASHVHFGRERLIASQPTLRPHLPATL